MPTISAALSIAIGHHRAGRLDLAEEIYRRILAAEPGHADALHLLGAAAHQQGRHEDAVDLIQAALKLRETEAAFNNLGKAYHALGKMAEAEVCYRQALELNPHYASAYNNLANLVREEGKLDEATACYRRALELQPEDVEVCNNLGNLLRALGKPDEAIACYERALQLEPRFGRVPQQLGECVVGSRPAGRGRLPISARCASPPRLP